jgi:hypothetical protein
MHFRCRRGGRKFAGESLPRKDRGRQPGRLKKGLGRFEMAADLDSELMN